MTWKVVYLEKDSGKWIEEFQSEELNKCRSALNSKSRPSAEVSIIAWDGDAPATNEELEYIIQDIFSANDGRVVRIMIGATVSIKRSQKFNNFCGECYCVRYMGTQTGRCEAFYHAGPDGDIVIIAECPRQCGGLIP